MRALISFIILNAIDSLNTWWIVVRSGGTEMNPALNYLMTTFNPTWTLILKVFVAMVIGFLAYKFLPKNTIRVMGGTYSLVVVWGFIAIGLSI